MLKIFTTQLNGFFKKIEEQEQNTIEEAARILAQAIVGDGNLFVYGVDEMKAITYEAIHGVERFPKIKELVPGEDIEKLTPLDRVLVATRFTSDKKAIGLAKHIRTKGTPVIAISAKLNNEDESSLIDEVDLFLDSKLTKALIPNDNGQRTGFPTVMTALYCYYALYLTTMEILEEHE